MEDSLYKRLLLKAKDATEFVFSDFCKPGQGSGAAILTKSGKIYQGGHIKFGAGGGNHAEISALNKAIETPADYVTTVALISTNPRTKDSEYQYPCGHCLQDFSDYLNKLENDGILPRDYNLQFICGNKNLEYEILTLDELLPKRFKTRK